MLEVPENTEEAQSFITDIWNKMKETLPGEIEKIWKQEVVPLWSKMMDIWSEWWDTSIQPWSQTTWDKIMTILGQEVEKRKPYVEQELQKEKEELIEEADQKIPEQGRSIWERFKELIQ
jgi:vacuolar-type H+-ATPase catalytic subunit A/Vma1